MSTSTRVVGPKESVITTAILHWLNARPDTLARKLHVSPLFGNTSEPDVYGSRGGRMFQLEVKRLGESPTPGQQHALDLWEAKGAVVACVHSVAEVRALWGDPGRW